jgi:tripartite-type tricarboxylate transporter receptor subunit TctC
MIRMLRLAVLLIVLALAPQLASAQAFPSKPIRIVVPFPPAGATDILARLIANKLSEEYGQQVVVDNRPGAGGNLGTDLVAKAPADGYTLLMGTVANTINATLQANLPFDFKKDFAPIGMVGIVTNVMVVPSAVPAKTPKEMVDHIKANPGKINFASSGNGTSIHMSGELFKMVTGADITHVPYRGSGPALTDLTAGHVQLMFDNLPSALPHIKAGTLRALAVTGPKRAPQLPDVPTMAEAGFPDVQAVAWFGLVAPAATPSDVLAKLNADVNKALALADMKQRMGDVAAEIQPMTAVEFGAFIAAEIEKWARVIKVSGAKVD